MLKQKIAVFAAAAVFFTVSLGGKALAEGENKGKTQKKSTSHGEAAKPAEGESKVDKTIIGKEKKVSQTPEKFKIVLDTTKGKVVIEATRSWSPKGVDRLYELVQGGFFKDIAFFRVIEGFVVQFGIHGDPKLSSQWKSKNIEDDPVKESNKIGTISFATAGAGTRTTQLFINLGDNTRLDGMGFSPVAKVVEGMDVVKKIYSGYGDGHKAPDQGAIQSKGNSYLKESFPEMDYIKSAEISK
jgi:peptidyl-prolyl cis-trans isomerase A (cyclophilin A)